MNYEKIYKDLVDSRKERGLIKEFGFEIHHILPRCLGGSDSKSNLVKLTFKEHYLAHKLLVKIKTGKEAHQMKLAVNFMMRDGRRPYCRNYYKEDVNNFAIRYYSHLHLYKKDRPEFINLAFGGKLSASSQMGDRLVKYSGLKFTRGNRKFMKLFILELKTRVLPSTSNSFWWAKSATVGGALMGKNFKILVDKGILLKVHIPSTLPDYYKVVDEEFLRLVGELDIGRMRIGFSSIFHREQGRFSEFLHNNEDLVILNPRKNSFIIYPRCLADLDSFSTDYVFKNMLSYKSKKYIKENLTEKSPRENCHITKEK